MKAYIHAFQGKPYNRVCQVARDGFHQLGIEIVLFSTNEEFDTRKPEDVVVGGMIMIRHALNQRGIPVQIYDYPEKLMQFRGRKIWRIRLEELQRTELPVFIKPVEEKIAQGMVVNELTDIREEYGMLGPDTELYCSEAVRFVSEWRCFLLYGQIAGIQFYSGDRNARYDRHVIEAAVEAFSQKTASCALDFGVTEDGRTLLIEMNDGYALGCYGLDPILYARVLTARWAELNHTEDPFRSLPVSSCENA